MPILFAWRALIVFKVLQNSLFLPNISFKIPNIAVKCSRSLFPSNTLYKKYGLVLIFFIIYSVRNLPPIFPILSWTLYKKDRLLFSQIYPLKQSL